MNRHLSFVRVLFFIRTIYKDNNILKISQITGERSFALGYLMMKSLTYFVARKK